MAVVERSRSKQNRSSKNECREKWRGSERRSKSPIREGQMMPEVVWIRQAQLKGMVVFSKPREGSSGTRDATGAKKKTPASDRTPKFLVLPLPGLPGSMPLPPMPKTRPCPRHLEGNSPSSPLNGPTETWQADGACSEPQQCARGPMITGAAILALPLGPREPISPAGSPHHPAGRWGRRLEIRARQDILGGSPEGVQRRCAPAFIQRRTKLH